MEECNDVLMWAKAASYLLQSVPLNLALPQFLQQHELGLLQSQLLLQLLNDTLPLSWAALLHSIEHSGTYTTHVTKKNKKMKSLQVTEHPLIPLSPQSTSNHTVQHL